LIAIKDDDKRARHNQLIAKNDSIAKYDTKITNEIDGLIGKSSGVIGDGPSAQEKKEIRERMLKEWHLLNYQDSIKNISIDSDITKIKNDTEKIIKSKKYSNDYLAQRHALTVLAAEPANSDIWWVKIFLTVFLIFIDVCCILYKAATHKGPYDDHINYEEFISNMEYKNKANDADAQYRARKEFNQTSGKDFFIESSKERQRFNANRESVAAIFKSGRIFCQKMTEEHISFGKFVTRRRREIDHIEDIQIKEKENETLNCLITDFYNKSNRAFQKHEKM